MAMDAPIATPLIVSMPMSPRVHVLIIGTFKKIGFSFATNM